MGRKNNNNIKLKLLNKKQLQEISQAFQFQDEKDRKK